MTHIIRRKFLLGISALCVALLSASLLGGCGSPAQKASEPAQKEKAAQTRTITDSYGRSVTIPAQVKTAATVGCAARYVVYAGGMDKLVACTEKEKKPGPNRPYAMAYKDKFDKLPITSNGNHRMDTAVDTEKMLGLHPDVILSSRTKPECDKLQEQLKIPVVGVDSNSEIFGEGVSKSITIVGDVLGCSEHAKKVTTAIANWKADLDKRTKDIPDAERPKAYVGAVNYRGAKSITGTCAHYPVFEAIHARNVADESGQKSEFDTTFEQIGTWNPDVMFLNQANMNLMQKDYNDHKAFFDKLNVFKEGKIYTQPFFNFNGTNVEMAICDTFFCGKVMYPKQFADMDMPKKYDEIFTTLLGKAYYADLKAQGFDFTTITFK